MKHMKIELIYFLECPNIEDMRQQLLKACAEVSIEAKWKEWDRNSNKSPDYVRKYASPTILINGKDIAETTEVKENCCRVYIEQGDTRKVPSVETIVKAMMNPNQ